MTEVNTTASTTTETPKTDEVTNAPVDKKMVWIIYALYGLGFFVGITFIAGVIVAHVTGSDQKGSLLQSHISYQIRTFWWSLIWVVISFILSFFGIGVLTMIVAVIWTLYRVIKGAIRFNANKEV